MQHSCRREDIWEETVGSREKVPAFRCWLPKKVRPFFLNLHFSSAVQAAFVALHVKQDKCSKQRWGNDAEVKSSSFFTLPSQRAKVD